jgi:hypothetical protein
MTRYIVIHFCSSRPVYAVLDAHRDSREVCRCTNQADAANICSALNAREHEAQEAEGVKP